MKYVGFLLPAVGVVFVVYASYRSGQARMVEKRAREYSQVQKENAERRALRQYGREDIERMFGPPLSSKTRDGYEFWICQGAAIVFSPEGRVLDVRKSDPKKAASDYRLSDGGEKDRFLVTRNADGSFTIAPLP